MDIKQLGESLVAVMKEYVGKHAGALSDRLDALSKRLDDLPAPVDGKDGRDGVDADMKAVEALVQGEVIKALADIPKAKDGIDGNNGRDGQDGQDGRDAVEIDVLRGIDETRRYRRGSYASHNGGLWKAVRSTEGMDGWECILDGEQDFTIELGEDMRTFGIKRTMASGRVIEKSFCLPVVLDRGVFKEGQTYAAGDAVTWGGSVWIAREANSTKPDDANRLWRLSVKKGRDAK